MQADLPLVPLSSLPVKNSKWLKEFPEVNVVTNQYITRLDPKLSHFRIYEIEVEPKVQKDSYLIYREAIRQIPESIKELFKEEFYDRKENVIWCISPRELQQASVGQYLGKYQIEITGNSYTISLKLIKKSKLLSEENGTIKLTNESRENINFLRQAINIFMKRKILQNCKSIKEHSRNVFTPSWGEYYHKDGLVTRICFKLSIEYIHLTLYSQINKKIKSLYSQTLLQVLQNIKGNKITNSAYLNSQMVTTLYGKEKTFVLKEIKWELNPYSMFQGKDGEISYIDYYKRVYNIRLKQKQPLVLVETLKRNRIYLEGGTFKEKKNLPIIIPAQLLAITRVPYHIQKKHRRQIMNELTPNKCIEAAYEFINEVNHCQKDFQIQVTNRQEKARLLLEPIVVISPTEKIQPINGTFLIKQQKNQSVKINPVFVYSANQIHQNHDLKQIQIQANLFQNFGKNYNVYFTSIEYIKIDDRQGIEGWMKQIDSFLEKQRDSTNKSCEQTIPTKKYFFFVTLKDQQESLYNPIKCHITFIKKMKSQFYYRSKLSQVNYLSICHKIMKQIAAKNGISLWKIDPIKKFKEKRILVIGMSVLRFDGKFQLVVTRNIDKEISKFEAQAYYLDTQQIPTATLREIAKLSMKDFTKTNKNKDKEQQKKKEFSEDRTKHNQSCPDIVFIYRSGLNNQKYAQSHIQNQFEGLKKIYNNAEIVYIQVKSRSSKKMWINQEAGHQQGILLPKVTNTQVGTVLRGRTDQDFYIVSSTPNDGQGGSANPVWYNVVKNKSDLEMGQIIQFTFSQTYQYYNWQGSVRLPQVLQLAKKCHQFPKPSDKTTKRLKLNMDYL